MLVFRVSRGGEVVAKMDESRQKKLTIQQQNAIDLLVQGRNDREVAETIGMSRQIITEWRNNNAEFIAELNDRRQQVWGTQTDRLRQLLAQAVDALADDLQSGDPERRTAAAIHVLKCVGIYGANLEPTGTTNVDDIKLKWSKEESWRQTERMMAEASL